MYNISGSSRLDKPFSISTLESYDTKMKSEYLHYMETKSELKTLENLNFIKTSKNDTKLKINSK